MTFQIAYLPNLQFYNLKTNPSIEKQYNTIQYDTIQINHLSINVTVATVFFLYF